MKYFLKGTIIAIFFLTVSGVYSNHGLTGSAEASGSNTIDYLSLPEFDTLTPAQIQAAAALKIMFRHASVGSNINDGLNALAASNPLYNRANFSFQARGNPGWQAKIQDLIDQTQIQLANFSIFSMKFCYIDTNADVNAYIQAMENLEAAYPSKKLVWWTMPTNTSGDNQAYNNVLRVYATAHNKVLLDIASVEPHHADGNVSAYDAALAAQAAVGLITLTPDQITRADVSGDGKVSAYDAALIAQKAVGLISKFPVEG